MEFQVVDKSKWETLTPAPKATKEDKYAKVLDTLEAGEIVSIPTQDAKELKGVKITLGRKSATRGFRVETRTEGNILYVKKSEDASAPAKPKSNKKKEAVEA